MSSGVESDGMLTVLEMAPERNGCTAAIILMCPIVVDGALAVRGREGAVEDRAGARRFSQGAPSIISTLVHVA